MIVRLTKDNIPEVIATAITILRQGGVIGYPTETFYGLGAKYDREEALRRIYGIKKRPLEKTMPLIIGKREDLPLVAEMITAQALSLMERFWPGPLTLLVKARMDLPEQIVSEGKVAVRMPGDSFALMLAQAAGFPYTSTSANPSGMPPAETAAKLLEYFGDAVDLIIDGGRTTGGLPSTIVDTTGEEPVVVRKGAVDLTTEGED